MRKSLLTVIVFGAIAVALGFPGAPAYAQASRTWVSGVGDDVNPCSRTAPCKTFAGAISKTAAGGEINCLDPGGFGALTITKSIISRARSVPPACWCREPTGSTSKSPQQIPLLCGASISRELVLA